MPYDRRMEGLVIHKHVMRSRKPGFRIYLMRWQGKETRGEIAGAGIRAFGRNFEFYTDTYPPRNVLPQLRYRRK
jgi:hypothetical protein